ncbi:hypothetical protein PFICI_09749 [Pestalotiopsis fici W106-1]|uniref:Major facilitator superfamily (MFS) profile domain-containing protein n=1 Tax=Pestalotiopsis fici (strain W106-1 / CGMCC3.15140) TaxID=1229662 RepID=W3WX43_PESFW|nr:uncharacterized protein PFICI_09749 [Pestalotiopsis fici W106-1]ETS77687.1 hypothetical protein PFICI_09749 [Pestalotiopsis fici W106-1]
MELRGIQETEVQSPADQAPHAFDGISAKSSKAKIAAANAVQFLAGMNGNGRLAGAFTNVHISARLGIGGTLVVGSISQILAYALVLWKPPFPLFACSFFFSGLGVAYQDAQSNAFVANLDNAYRWLGILHAIFGVGALVSPLAATAIASRTPHWHYYFIILLGLASANLVVIIWAFWPSLLKVQPSKSTDSPSKELWTALTQRPVWVLSGFFFLYVGAEITAGGYVVEFLISVRNGEPSSVGYVASGFWGGLALGRVVLADITNILGERRMIFVYIAIAIALQLLFWLVPNIIASAVVVSLLGFIIAPFFPVGISVLIKLLPKELHVAAVGLTATIGQAGSAAFPFMTGAIASAKGVGVLQPIMIALLGGMCVLWFLMPRVSEHPE